MCRHSFKDVKIEISVFIDFFNPLLQHAIIGAGREDDFNILPGGSGCYSLGA